VNRILADIVKYAKPIEATLIGDFMPRGGVHTKITARYKK
jgi:NADPH-dependent 7-cyano-7-deazaguanine reductase QueF